MKVLKSLFRKDDDLFANGTMGFGDHLEELRTCLWRCIVWLSVGFLIGLFFGGDVVAYIQSPLTKALKKFYIEQSTAKLTGAADQLQSQGYPDWIASIPQRTQMIPEEFYVYPGTLERLLESNAMILDPLHAPPPHQIDNGSGDNGNGNHLSLLEVDNLNTEKMKLAVTYYTDTATKLVSSPRPIPQIQYTQNPQMLMLFRKVDSDHRLQSQALTFHESFSIYLRAAMLVGVVVASPFILYHLWSFVAVGLYTAERKIVYMFMPFSIFLFIAGAALAFYVIFQFILDFLLKYNAWLNIDPAPRINEWLSFAILLPVGFGISFQLPLVMFAMERIGIFTIGQYISQWKIAILVIFGISMLLTPADPWSMVLMAVPLTGLYFFGVSLCAMFPKKVAPVP